MGRNPDSALGRDPYLALGVSRGAAAAEIKSAYRRRARALHPDVNRTDPDAAEKFKELVAAYELLVDPLRRSAYDRGGDRAAQAVRDFGSWTMDHRRWEEFRRPQPQAWNAGQVVRFSEPAGLRRGRRTEAPLLHRLVMSPDLSRVAAHRGDAVELWNSGSGRSVARTGRDETGIRWVDFSPDGRLLITEGARGTMLWDAATGREVDRLNLDGPGHLTFSSDGRFLATAALTLAQVREVASGRDVAQIPHPAPLACLALSPDGRRLATGAGDDAYVWDLSSGRELARLAHEKRPAAVKLSSDGRLLAVSTTVARSAWTPTAVQLWDVETREEVGRFPHSCWVDQIVFSPDGRRLATDSNGTVHLWDAARGHEIARMQFVGSELRFSPDSRWLAGGFGHYLYVWDADTGHQLACLGHEGNVLSVAVDRDGRRIGSASHDRTGEAPGVTPLMANVWLRDYSGG